MTPAEIRESVQQATGESCLPSDVRYKLMWAARLRLADAGYARVGNAYPAALWVAEAMEAMRDVLTIIREVNEETACLNGEHVRGKNYGGRLHHARSLLTTHPLAERPQSDEKMEVEDYGKD